MKLCVIGSSHVAMLMLAERDAPTPGLDLTFYAAPSGGVEAAELDGTTLRAVTPELRARLDMTGAPHAVDLNDFDAVVFVGETVSVFSAVALVRQANVSDWPSAAPLIAAAGEPFAPVLKRPLLTRAAYVAALAGAAREKLTYRLARALRERSDVPIAVVPQPYPAERVLEGNAPVVRRIHRDGDGASLATCLAEAHEAAFAGIDRLHIVSQPPETVTGDFLTHDAFARHAMRLSLQQRQPKDDVLHMGGAYGRLALDAVLAALRDPAMS